MSAAEPRTAFVTGGSGFIGGRLIERLAGEGWTVKALARSEASAQAVREKGAEPVRGDLDDVSVMRAGANGCEVAFHAAAKVEAWGPWEDFARVNVAGTHNALRAAREAGVRRFVHVGTEAALLDGRPLVNADERAALRPDSPAPYSASKALAEQAVRQASEEGFETEPVVFRDFVSELLGTQGVDAPEASVPTPLAGAAARAVEALWRATNRDGDPPLTRFVVWVSSQECTLDISKARRELGYAPVKSRAEGMAELRG